MQKENFLSECAHLTSILKNSKNETSEVEVLVDQALVFLENNFESFYELIILQGYTSLLTESVGLLVQNELLLHNFSIGNFWSRISSIVEKLLDYITYEAATRFKDLFRMRILLVISHIFSIRKPFMEKVIIEDCYLTSMEMVENKPKDWETYPEWQEMFEIYENIENTYYLRNTCLKRNYSNVKSMPNPLKVSPIEVFQSNSESRSNDAILPNEKENFDQNKLVTISKSSTKEDSMAIENLDKKYVRIENVSDTNSNTIKENGDKNSNTIKENVDIEISIIDADDFDSKLGSYVDSLLQVVEEAMHEAAFAIRLKLEAEDKEKRAKKFVVDFSTPYRPSTQQTTYRPVLLPPKKPENEIPVIVKKLSYDTNTGDDLLNNLNPLPKLNRPNFSRF